MNRTNKPDKNGTKLNKYKFLTTFVCIFVAIILVLGLTLGIISAVKNSEAAIKYNGHTLNREETSYFLSYYKYRYMSNLSESGVKYVEDTPGFWNKVSDKDGKTYGELLREESESFLKELIVAVSIFDKYEKISSAEKDTISSAVKKVLTYKADGSREKFDSLAADYGFSYNSFKSVAKILYKAGAAEEAIYGANGAYISAFPELCSEYLSEYSHVKLLFIRTEDKFLLDGNGNKIVGNGGYYETVKLTEEEKAERDALISEINGYIDAIGTGGVEMGATMFDYYIENHDEGNFEINSDGYYFHPDSEFTRGTASELPEIVDKALSMDVNSFDSVKTEFGVCFIYKYEPTQGAYSSVALKDCFGDFYKNAASRLFDKEIKELSGDVVLTDIYDRLDIVSIPYNYSLIP